MYIQDRLSLGESVREGQAEFRSRECKPWTDYRMPSAGNLKNKQNYKQQQKRAKKYKKNAYFPIMIFKVLLEEMYW